MKYDKTELLIQHRNKRVIALEQQNRILQISLIQIITVN
jgi:hypothetical protein